MVAAVAGGRDGLHGSGIGRYGLDVSETMTVTIGGLWTGKAFFGPIKFWFSLTRESKLGFDFQKFDPNRITCSYTILNSFGFDLGLDFLDI